MIDTELIRTLGQVSDEAYEDYDINDQFGETPYTVLAKKDTPSGMQAYLLQESGTGKYVFAFRGTEPGHAWNDIVLADGAMVMGTAPQQMKDALGFVHEISVRGLETSADRKKILLTRKTSTYK